MRGIVESISPRSVGRFLKDLKQRIASVEPEFELLSEICADFKQKITTMRDRQASSISNSFSDFRNQPRCRN